MHIHVLVGVFVFFRVQPDAASSSVSTSRSRVADIYQDAWSSDEDN